MAQGKTSTARRREVRRNLPKAQAGWRELIRKPEFGWAVLFATVFAVVATAIASPLIDRDRPMHLGQAVERPIVSRVPYTVIDEDATRLDRRFAADQVPPQFEADRSRLDALRQELNDLPASLTGYETLDDVPESLAQSMSLTPGRLTAFKAIGITGSEENKRWQRSIEELTRGLYDTAIVSEDQWQDLKTTSIAIHHPDPAEGETGRRVKAIRAVLTPTDERFALELDQLVAPLPAETRAVIKRVLSDRIEPTYTYSDTLTRAMRDAARGAVPVRIESREAGVVIAQPGQKASQALLDEVLAEEAAYLDARSPVERWAGRAAMLAVMSIVAGGMWVYFFAYCPRLVRNPMRGVAITALLLLCLGASVYSSLLWPDFIIGSLTFPTLFAATVLAIAYDQRFALAMGVVLAMLVVIMLKLPLATTLIVVVGVAIGVMQLREIRTRSKLLIVGTYAGLAMGFTAAVVGLAVKPIFSEGVLQTVLIDALAAITSGFFTGLLVQGALPLIERAFNVTTAMTLKELNDASHPLLQRLAHEAPGTYQHSLRIADMAEAAAEAIGADALLCRVGSMYHDIGKTNKPAYFIENQAGGPNKHAKLPPAMSLLIIVGHVKDGVEMAREFGLPIVIRHFIESHHGTTLVEYFYHEAKKQTEAEDKPGPSEFEFRYPGPKPTTREAAIMMLCDCVEGAARAMDEPTATRLENLVRSMANKRLMDGQFDDCDLTLQDLSRIEQAITKSLTAMYHQRIKYPEDKKPSDEREKTAAG